jgi:uncharacterized protein YgiM (DUF1202 family)
MFKLIFFLCSGLFLAMLVAGQDHGQQRFGLIAKPPEPAAEVALPVEATAIAPEPEPMVVEAAFAPAKPVMTAPVADPVTEASAPAPEPTGRILYIDAKSVNVRSGPGKDFDVVDRLKRGEAVLVVSEGEGPDGWSLIRIEGDGVEGYVAARLLRE